MSAQDMVRCCVCQSTMLKVNRDDDTVECQACGTKWESIDSFNEEAGTDLEE